MSPWYLKYTPYLFDFFDHEFIFDINTRQGSGYSKVEIEFLGLIVWLPYSSTDSWDSSWADSVANSVYAEEYMGTARLVI